MLELILGHPLNRQHRLGALSRWVGWQGWKLMVRRPITYEYWDGLRVRVYPDWPYSWTAVYLRLPEFDDMMFTLRYLQAGDAFIDVGANIGLYSLLASSVNGAAPVFAYEPHPIASERLRENVILNSLNNIVVRPVAVGDVVSAGRLSANLVDQNRLEAANENFRDTLSVPIVTLDSEVSTQGIDPAKVALVKVDTEGFEARVLIGAQQFLDANPGPVWLVELTGLGHRYGSSDSAIHAIFTQHGYHPFRYLAAENRVIPDVAPDSSQGNLIFARRPQEVAARLETALDRERKIAGL